MSLGSTPRQGDVFRSTTEFCCGFHGFWPPCFTRNGHPLGKDETGSISRKRRWKFGLVEPHGTQDRAVHGVHVEAFLGDRAALSSHRLEPLRLGEHP